MSFKYNSFYHGDGVPLIFQHGLSANTKQIISLLGGMEGIQLIGIDCPGHGNSALNNFVPSFDNYTDQVIGYMDSLKIECAIVGGLSMGAGIALNICLRYPHRVNALILHRPAWLDNIDPENLMILKEPLPYMNMVNGRSKFMLTSSYLSIEKVFPLAAKSVLGIFGNDQQAKLTTVIEKLVGDKPFNNIKMLRTIKIPCLILGNENDPLHPFKMAKDLHNNIGGSILKKITSRYIDGELHKEEVRENILNFIKTII